MSILVHGRETHRLQSFPENPLVEIGSRWLLRRGAELEAWSLLRQHHRMPMARYLALGWGADKRRLAGYIQGLKA